MQEDYMKIEENKKMKKEAIYRKFKVRFEKFEFYN